MAATALPPRVAALVNAAAIRFGVRPAFARAVAWVESKGDQAALSGAGAIGVMQLMPATARGLKVDPHDINQNIEGGVRLLATHLKDFSEELAAAAYNGGTVQLYKDPANWPAETRKYVPLVMARAALEEGLTTGPYITTPRTSSSAFGLAIAAAGAVALTVVLARRLS